MAKQKQQNEKPEQHHFALADFALKMVVKEGDDYTFQGDADEGLRLALEGLFGEKALDPKMEIEALLRLGWLFESKHGALGIANTIVDALAKDDRALSVLGINSGKKTRQVRKRFARFAGQEDKVAAPVFGQAAPKGTLKVSSFLEPGKEMGRGKKPTVAPKKRDGRTKTPTRRRRRITT